MQRVVFAPIEHRKTHNDDSSSPTLQERKKERNKEGEKQIQNGIELPSIQKAIYFFAISAKAPVPCIWPFADSFLVLLTLPTDRREVTHEGGGDRK